MSAIPRRGLVTLLAYLETGSHKAAAHRLGIIEFDELPARHAPKGIEAHHDRPPLLPGCGRAKGQGHAPGCQAALEHVAPQAPVSVGERVRRSVTGVFVLVGLEFAASALEYLHGLSLPHDVGVGISILVLGSLLAASAYVIGTWVRGDA